MLGRWTVAALAATAIAGAPGGAEAAALAPLAGAERPLRADGARCDTARWVAPADASIRVRLLGGQGSDWDLTVHGDGRRLGGSAGFGAREVVTALVRRGSAVVARGCRRSGRRAVRLALDAVRLPVVAAGDGATALVRVHARRRADVALLQRLGLDLGEHGWREGVDVVLRGAAQLRALKATGLRFDVRAADLAALQRSHRAADRAFGARVGRSALPSGRTAYRTLEDHEADLKKLADQHPDLVKPLTLAAPSFQGRSVNGVTVGAGSLDDGRPTFLLVGIHHAREWPAGEMVTEWLTDLLANRRDRRVRNLLKRTRIVAVPIMNVDGFVASRTAFQPTDPVLITAESAIARFNYHRGTCSGVLPAAAPCDLNSGADPNRNYAPNWGNLGSSSLPYLSDYRGEAPWSESETENIHRLAQELNVTTAMSMHNVAGLMLRPPGVLSDGPPPDEEAMKRLGDAMGRATGYRSTSFADGLGYDGSGITEDWVYGAQGAFTYTTEVGGSDFHGPFETHVVQQYEKGASPSGTRGGVREALFLIAEAARDQSNHSRLRGRARRGRVLRLKKSFKTLTEPVCTVSEGLTGAIPCLGETAPLELDDFVSYSMTVPRNGRVDWHVAPSTRPFEAAAGKVESYTLTCEAKGVVKLTREVVVERGRSLNLGRLRC